MTAEFLEISVAKVHKLYDSILYKFQTESWCAVIAACRSTRIIRTNDYVHPIIKKEALVLLTSKYAYRKFTEYNNLPPFKAIYKEVKQFYEKCETRLSKHYTSLPVKQQLSHFEIQLLSLVHTNSSLTKISHKLQIPVTTLKSKQLKIFEKFHQYNWFSAIQQALLFQLISTHNLDSIIHTQLKTSSANILRTLISDLPNTHKKTAIYEELIGIYSSIIFQCSLESNLY